MRAQKLALDAQGVAVPAAEMKHRFDPGVLLDQLAGDLRAQARARARSVRNVDAVDARGLAEPGAFNFLRRVDASRGQNFNERHELSRGELRSEPALQGHGTFSHAPARTGKARRWRCLPCRLRMDAARLQASRLFADVFDVLRSGATAAAHDAGSRLQHPPRILRHILRASRDRGCGLRQPSGRPAFGITLSGFVVQRNHLLDGFEHDARARKNSSARSHPPASRPITA